MISNISQSRCRAAKSNPSSIAPTTWTRSKKRSPTLRKAMPAAKSLSRLIRRNFQHRVATEFSGAEFFESSVRFFERKYFDFGFHRPPRRDLEKFFAVVASQVRDRRNHAFVPKIDIGKRWDIAHMNSAADNGAALSEIFKCDRNERTNRREDDCRIQLFRWRFIGTSCPSCA